MRKPYDSFIFTHIPKCGGSSLRAMFYEAAKLSSIDESQIHIPGEGKTPSSKNLPNLTDQELQSIRQKRIRIIADHSKYNTHIKHRLDKIKNPFYFTVLRDPVDRFISHYNFFYYKLGYGGLKGVTINSLDREKRRKLIDSIANLQISYLINKKSKVPCNAQHCKKAINSLTSNFHCFGVLEEIESTLFLLDKLSPKWFSLPKIIPSKNVNTLNNKDISPNSDIREEIKNANKLDYILYDYSKYLINVTRKLYNIS